MGACMMAVPRVVGLGEEGVLSVSSKLQQSFVCFLSKNTRQITGNKYRSIHCYKTKECIWKKYQYQRLWEQLNVFFLHMHLHFQQYNQIN